MQRLQPYPRRLVLRARKQRVKALLGAIGGLPFALFGVNFSEFLDRAQGREHMADVVAVGDCALQARDRRRDAAAPMMQMAAHPPAVRLELPVLELVKQAQRAIAQVFSGVKLTAHGQRVGRHGQEECPIGGIGGQRALDVFDVIGKRVVG
ncbi:MAG TPA: hypothetical protein DEQ40_14320, partial [Oxalobacteraceae bacterium]|nr:hypothetical protein [Oxalobacteraceae bacterium]